MPGIYIHIPFCKQACHYCNFHFSTFLKNKNEFLQALYKEIVLRKTFFSSQGNHETISTIYFGGGTPSLLSENEINKIIEHINNHFAVSLTAEITLEANPDDLTEQKIAAIKQTPVNRLSIGIQSFDDDDLKIMNRAHTSVESNRCVTVAQDAGFSNISIDLMYGLPGLSNEKWKGNLQHAFALNVQHISCYNLTLEEKTALAKMVQKEKISLLSENQSAEQFFILMDEMKAAGFVHYEISNFCKESFYSKHNTSYWQGDMYLGLGPSAHSFNGKTRAWSIANNNTYIKAIAIGADFVETEELNIAQQYNEYVMTGLRTMWGCDLTIIQNRFGEKFAKHTKKEAEKYFSSKKLIQQNNKLFLSKEGKLIADVIAADLFWID